MSTCMSTCICFWENLVFDRWKRQITSKCIPRICRLRKEYALIWAANCFLARGYLNTLLTWSTKFWKFEFHLEHFPRNKLFLSFDGLSNYLYLRSKFFWKNPPKRIFLWPEECPSSHVKVAKIWFGPKIKHLLGSFFADFYCRDLLFKEITYLNICWGLALYLYPVDTRSVAKKNFSVGSSKKVGG